MAKETEKRLIRTLEFLKEPQGSTIPTIVKAMNDEGPQVSLKRVVQTLKGCLDNGILKVSDGRVKLKQLNAISSPKPKSKVEKYLLDSKTGSGKCVGSSGKSAGKCTVRKNGIPKSPKICKPVSVVGANSEEPKIPGRSSEGGSDPGNETGNAAGAGAGSGGGEESIADHRARASVCKPKARPRPKARCAQRCPKARTRRRKQKQKCIPPKRRAKRRKRKRQRKCKKKPKIQPYCRKQQRSRPTSKC